MVTETKSYDTKIYISNTVFIKAILLLMVILGHSIAYWAADWFTGNASYRPEWAVILFQWLASFHVFGFALVSGYIFACQMEKGAYSFYLEFLKKKVKRLLIPYIFVATVWVIPISMILLHWDGTYILKNFILCEGPSQLWFLWMLFDVFILARVLWKFISQNILIGWGVTLALYLAGSVGHRYVPNYFGIWTACQYFTFFYMGVRLWNKSFFLRIPWFVWIVWDIVLFTIYYLNPLLGRIGQLLSLGLPLLLHMTGALMAFSTLGELSQKVKWRNKTFFSEFCKLSMPIYLFHQQLIYLVITVFNNRIPIVANMILNFLISLLFSVLIGWLLMKNKYTRFLIGEK